MNNFITTTKTKTKKTDNPFKKNPMPGFGNMASAWDGLMSSGQKVIDNRRKK